MTNKPKRVGTAAEVAVVAYLNNAGIPCERRALAGINDRGDVAGIPGIVIEVKNHGRMELAAWVDEARTESRMGLTGDIGVVWHKRRGCGSPGRWYVTMDGSAFLPFLAALLKETGR